MEDSLRAYRRQLPKNREYPPVIFFGGYDRSAGRFILVSASSTLAHPMQSSSLAVGQSVFLDKGVCDWM